MRLLAWIGFRRHVSEYRLLGEDELRRTRKSDTVFIFGSGYSLNDMSPAEWRAIEAHDTIGFNWFVHQRFVRCDYHLVREIGSADMDRNFRMAELVKYFDLARTNPKCGNTIFLIQTGFKATSGNRAIGFRQVPVNHPVFLWRSIHGRLDPSRSLSHGLTHTHGTLNEVVNFAFLMGWTRIVIAGVDLYDRRYFWLAADEPLPGDVTVEALHNTAAGGVVEGLGRWRTDFERSGVGLFVYNPKSLLARVLPVWNREA